MADRGKRGTKRKGSNGSATNMGSDINLKELEQNDAESAALIKAMLMQDQMNNPYYDDAYDNDFVKEAPAVKAPRDKKASDDEDDDFVPEKVKREIREKTGQIRKRGPRKRKLDEMSDGLGSDLQPNQADSATIQTENNESGANGTANGAATNGTSLSTSANGTIAASSATTTNNTQQAQGEDKEELSTSDGEPNKKKRKKDKPVNPNHKIGPWTDEEEKRFLESMELYGREWDKVADHIATRDKNSIRSHAQKYFIKCFRDGTPMPSKVLESGDGHTLSGKPLDPDSAAAKQYLGKGMFTTLGPPLSNILQAFYVKRQKDLEASGQLPTPVEATPNASAPEPASPKKPGKRGPKKKEKKPFRENDLGMNIGEILYGESKPHFSRDRLRNRNSINWQQLGDDRDPLTMVKCSRYDQDHQPFKVSIHSNVMFVADLHAHLTRTEIIGFLAGRYDAAAGEITITEAFPCKSLHTGDDDVNVELDPQSELETRDAIAKKNLTVVGWYHSHPVFQPDPSLRDIENQTNYQILFKDEQHKKEPFVGIIIGTYDTRLKDEQSVINWFHVESRTAELKGQPMYMVHDYIQDEDFSQELQDQVMSLLEFYKAFDTRTKFSDTWRYNKKMIEQDATAKIEPVNNTNGDVMSDVGDQVLEDDKPSDTPTYKVEKVTKLDKMRGSIAKKLPSKWTQEQSSTLLNKISAFVEQHWDVAPYQAKGK